MKNSFCFLVIITALFFVTAQTTLAVSPSATEHKLREIRPVITLKKFAPPRLMPDLTITDVQLIPTQQLQLVRYHVKIRNDSDAKYDGGDQLVFNARYYTLATSQHSWGPIEMPVKTLGPIEPGKEQVVAGDLRRSGEMDYIKAIVMFGNKQVTSSTAELPAMPDDLDVRITNSHCSGNRLWTTIKNMTHHCIDTNLALQYYLKPENESEFQPAGGRGFILLPQREVQMPKEVTPGAGLMKVAVFYTGMKTVTLAETIVDLNTCN